MYKEINWNINCSSVTLPQVGILPWETEKVKHNCWNTRKALQQWTQCQVIVHDDL